MVLQRSLAIGLLDIVGCGISLDVEDLVGINVWRPAADVEIVFVVRHVGD